MNRLASTHEVETNVNGSDTGLQALNRLAHAAKPGMERLFGSVTELQALNWLAPLSASGIRQRRHCATGLQTLNRLAQQKKDRTNQ